MKIGRFFGILFSHIKEGKPAICENMERLWGPYAKWNKQKEKDKYCVISLICGIKKTLQK